MKDKTPLERINPDFLKVSRSIVQNMTPEECKLWLLNKILVSDFPDVYERKQDRIAAVKSQEMIYDELIANFG